MLTILVFIASCQKETVETGCCDAMTYRIEIPESIGTKTAADGIEGVTELIYEVHRAESEGENHSLTPDASKLVYRDTVCLSNGIAENISIRLLRNQDARILFWAQCPKYSPEGERVSVYDAADLTNVKFNVPLIANTAEYVAFAGMDLVKSDDRKRSRTVTLERVVARLDLATSQESLVLGSGNASTMNTPVTINKSEVVVKGLANTFNVALMKSGDILSGNDEVVFVSSSLECLAGCYVSVNGTNYPYVAMNYIGFIPEEGTNVDVSYVLETSIGRISNTVSNVPVRPNYRTNIIGNLLTSDMIYTVSLDYDSWRQGSLL